jgi:hypothetical protein
MVEAIVISAMFALLADTAEVKCVRWIWWWDAEYKHKIAQCVEWKRVDRK